MRSILPIVFLFIISSVFILIGAWILNSNTKLANNGIVTDGRVVSIEEDYDIDNGSTYYPVVEFELEDGSRTTVKMSFGSNPPSYDLGEACEVIYYAGEQDSAKINSTFETDIKEREEDSGSSDSSCDASLSDLSENETLQPPVL